MMKRVYGRVWYMGEEGELGKCKESSSKIWGKTECRSKKARKDRFSGRIKPQKRELPENYITKMLYRSDDGKFKEENLKKLERNWQKWKFVSLEEKLWREVMSEWKMMDLVYFIFPFHFYLFSYFKT